MILHDEHTIQRYRDLGLWGDETLDDLFRQNLARKPDDLAVMDAPDRADFAFGAPKTLSYRELEDAVVVFASHLLDLGLGKDSVVFTHLPNLVETIVVYLAAVRIGAVICPAQMAYEELDLARKVEHVRPGCIVALEVFKERRPGKEFKRIAENSASSAPSVIALSPKSTMLSCELQPTTGQREQVAAHRSKLSTSADEVLGLLWTSGTTGFPKCAPRTHNNALSYAGITAEASYMREDSRVLVPLSLAHTSGLTCYFPAWLMTAGLLVLHQPFNLEVYLEQLETQRINATVAAPVMLNLLLKGNHLEGRDLSSLDAIMSGSAALDAWIIEEFESRYGVTIVNSFGSTEGIAMGTGPWMSERLEDRAVLYPRFLGSRRRPSALNLEVDDQSLEAAQCWPFTLAPGTEHKLIDLETGVEINEEKRPGEFCLRAPTLFAGYLNKDFSVDRDDFDADGFFRSGEIFEIVGSDKGPDFLHYIDRLKDVINRGGVKIPAGELNAVVQEHPAVIEAAVIGAPDRERGERICVVAVLRPDGDLSLEELNRFVREAGVAKYMWPEQLVIAPSLPRNATGKVLKTQLRDSLQDSP